MDNPLLITVNIGSASKKYAVFRGNEELIRLHVEKDEHTDMYIAHDSFSDETMTVTAYEFTYTLAYLEQIIIGNGFASDLSDVEAILMRVVAPGEYFQSHRMMDDEYFARLEKASELAPLHLALQRIEYDQMRSHLSEKGLLGIVKIWGISDSAFHTTLPDEASRYGIARADAEKYEIKRFGYHGLSASSIARRVSKGKSSPSRLIVCHLGGGCSVTAIKDDKSIENSMGMTPLEGLLMARRSGDIDPGALLALMEAKNLSVNDARAYLNGESGLLGVSNKSDDLRALLMAESVGDKPSSEAVELFVHRVKHYIGAYAAILGGVDTLVFTGTIGERSPRIRAKILSGLDGIGIIFDPKKNDMQGEQSADGNIEAESSKAKIAVMHTDEFSEMAVAYLEVR